MHKVSILFWLKAGKYISCRLTINGQRGPELATGYQTTKKNWDNTKQLVRGQSEEAILANKCIEKTRRVLLDIIDDMAKKSKIINPDRVIAKFKGDDYTQKTLIKSYEENISRMRQLEKKGEYKNTTVKRNESLKNMMQIFLKDFYKVEDVYLEQVDKQFIKDLELWGKTSVIDGMKDGKKVKIKKTWSHDTATKHLQKLSEIIGIAFEDGLISTNPFSNVSFKFSKPKQKYLHESIVKILEDSRLASEPLEMVKDMFLFQCYTGLAYSDVYDLSSDHIIRSVSGKLCINKSRIKTDEPIYIPLINKALLIMDKYKDHPMCQVTGKLLPVYTNQKYNAYLHEIGPILGISRKLTTHVARHTAATYLLNAGLSEKVICRILAMSPQTLRRVYGAVLNSTVEEEMEIVNQMHVKTSEEEINAEIIKLQEKLDRIKRIKEESFRMSS